MNPFSEFDAQVQTDVPLSTITWSHLGGPAQYLIAPQTVDALTGVVKRAREEQLPIRILGSGSNLLVHDRGVPGVVLRLTAPVFTEANTQGNRLKAAGGMKLGDLISFAVGKGLSGLESLVGIPGTVGGALRGNTGARNGDIGQWTKQATVMTTSGEIIVHSKEDLVFSYRKSSLDELVILSAEFHLSEEDPQELTRRLQKQWIVTKASQPVADEGLCLIFKDPPGMDAAMLIEQAQLKGTRVGEVEVSDRHANFFLFHENASFEDTLRLIELVTQQVSDRSGIELEVQPTIW
ncbi:UDP-N-acetylenolpyruvoylglucosamine reductase [Planctomycetales bacterium 10988]|nr:UDP-N-acetylenolpyruvoylglucosamine reductase [Planctomycetales bacterium 10988]